jgi:hypothetical protein
MEVGKISVRGSIDFPAFIREISISMALSPIVKPGCEIVVSVG